QTEAVIPKSINAKNVVINFMTTVTVLIRVKIIVPIGRGRNGFNQKSIDSDGVGVRRERFVNNSR
ncbi:MAG: hypothetical protein WBN68_15410, partial [Sedimenticolaceae bacterium]